VAHASALYAANQQVAILKHDLNNTLINIRSYLKLRQYEKLEQYLAQMQTQLQLPTLADHGMPFIDAVLSAKFENHPEIKFTEDISPLQLKHIPQTDIAMILAIALDNAIEACGQCPAPFIEIRLAQDGLILSLVITNSAVRPVRHTGDVLLTTKREKQDHGLGMKSMERIAAQNHGSLTWSCEKERFRLCVLLQDLPRDGGAAT
jgi:sensor histidine kinase regulating citrate/malate metabolism